MGERENIANWGEECKETPWLREKQSKEVTPQKRQENDVFRDRKNGERGREFLKR